MVSGKMEKSTPSTAVLKTVSTYIGIFISMPKFAEREKMISFLLQPSTNSESVKELPTLLFCVKAISGPFKEFSSKNTAELKAASLTFASFKRIVYHPPHCT